MNFDLKNKKILAGGAGVLALALAVGGGVAYAQKSNPLDANGDGVITQVEAKAAAEARFAKMDANSDGRLDKSDMDARHAEMHEKRFTEMDTDKNGAISKAEWDAAPMMRGGPDGKGGPGMDGDGPRGGHGKHGRGDGDGKGGRGGKGGFGGGFGGPGMMDANKDGTVTKDEAVAAAMTRFSAADTNKDGKVTTAEFDAAKAARRAEMDANRPAPPAPPADNAAPAQ